MSRQFKDPRTLFQNDIESTENRHHGAVQRRRPSLSITDIIVVVVLAIWLLVALLIGFAVVFQ